MIQGNLQRYPLAVLDHCQSLLSMHRVCDDIIASFCDTVEQRMMIRQRNNK